MTINPAMMKALEQAAEKVDMTKPVASGYTPPAKGQTIAVLVGYHEVGLQKTTYLGEEKTVDQVHLVFELTGKKHPPRELDDGTLLPVRMTVKATRSTSSRAKIMKMFKAMNYAGDVTHMGMLLGRHFIVDVTHSEQKGESKTVYANIDTNTIRKPEVINSEGDVQAIGLPAFLTTPTLFLWDFPDKQQWDDIFIDGTWEARKDEKGNITSPERSRNVIQDTIKGALNFEGSQAQTMLAEAALDAIDSSKVAKKETKKAEPEVVDAVEEETSAGADPLADFL